MQRLRANRNKLISFRAKSERMSKSLLVLDSIILRMFYINYQKVLLFHIYMQYIPHVEHVYDFNIP